MPAKTTIKLRAGTQAQWVATIKGQTLTGASVVATSNPTLTVVRYTVTTGNHTFTVGQVVNITGFSVISGNNPYNIVGGVISAVATATFDITIADGTTGGTSSGTGTADLLVLAKGEAAVETDTNSLKIGDGVTAWASIPYVNKSLYYVLNAQEGLTNDANQQDLLAKKIPLLANTTYQFEIQCNILTGNSTTKNLAFGFYQTGMTAFATTRYHWTLGTRANTATHYSDSTHTFAGNSPVTSGLIDLYPADGNPVVFFNIKGIIITGNGSSDFRPRIDWSATPGTTSVLVGSFVKLDPLGPSTVPFTGSWSS